MVDGFHGCPKMEDEPRKCFSDSATISRATGVFRRWQSRRSEANTRAPARSFASRQHCRKSSKAICKSNVLSRCPMIPRFAPIRQTAPIYFSESYRSHVTPIRPSVTCHHVTNFLISKEAGVNPVIGLELTCSKQSYRIQYAPQAAPASDWSSRPCFLPHRHLSCWLKPLPACGRWCTRYPRNTRVN